MADVPENGNQFFGCLHLLSGCVVYKPEDTRLHTLAALKFLPELIGVGVLTRGSRDLLRWWNRLALIAIPFPIHFHGFDGPTKRLLTISG